MKMLKHRKSSSGHREDDAAAQKVLKVRERVVIITCTHVHVYTTGGLCRVEE